jgi:hypothetical protein
MLKRVTGALFEGPADSQVQLVVQSQNNNGVESGRFEYDSVILPAETIQGHPGCTFTVLPSIRQFETMVVFDPASPPAARYDLFEVNSAGGLTALGESVTNAASTPAIGFGIDGVGVPVVAAKRARARKRPARAAAKRRTTPPKKAKTQAKTRSARSRKRSRRAAPRSRRGR